MDLREDLRVSATRITIARLGIAGNVLEKKVAGKGARDWIPLNALLSHG